MKPFFADTFAIVAAFRRDEKYGRRFRSGDAKTGILNVLEATHVLLAAGVAPADTARWVSFFRARLIPLPWEVVTEAAAFRLARRREGLKFSYADAAGYMQARAAGLPFLTGDPDFKGLEGVEFLPSRT